MTDKQTLFVYRLNQAEETLSDAEKMLQDNLGPRSIINRAYYSIDYYWKGGIRIPRSFSIN